MSNKPVGDAEQDIGQSTQYAGTVGTTAVAVPSVAGNDIILFLVRSPAQSPITKKLYWSFDDVTYHELSPGEYVGWPLKGSKKQIYVKGNVAGVNYEIVLNTEAT